MRKLTRFRNVQPILQHDPFRTLESFFSDFFSEEVEKNPVIRPAANIYEDENGQFCIELSAPEFDKKDFQVELEGQQLKKTTQNKETQEEKDKKTQQKKK